MKRWMRDHNKIWKLQSGNLGEGKGSNVRSGTKKS